MVVRVAVIGAGAAGLAVLRHMASRPYVYKVVALEQTVSVGGTWVYTERVKCDEYGYPIHSSMYANMRTNLPKEIMLYPGFPFPKNLPSFITHRHVDTYLNAFADHYGLRKHIRFNTIVEHVRPLGTKPNVTWEVTTKHREQPDCNTVEEYDAVFVCNGHFAVPMVPDLPGKDKFTGRIEHSHSYRHPEDYTGLRVAVLGAASSGKDIALDLARHADKVFLCHRKAPFPSSLPTNVTQHSGVDLLDGDTIMLQSGDVLESVDVLLLCTGYSYTFPFLDPECGVSTEGGRVTPVYKHIIHTQLTSLFFIGLCRYLPFPNFDCQVLFALAALEGTLQLPTQEEMEEDTEMQFQQNLMQGIPSRSFHSLWETQWDYSNELAAMAGFEPLHRIFRLIYEHVSIKRNTNLQGYKNINFLITGAETFVEVDPSEACESDKAEPQTGST